VNDAKAADRSKAFFEVRQAVASDQPVAISASARRGQALSVVLDGERERIGVEAQAEADFRSTGMFHHVVESFFKGEKKIVP
jgi:phosphate uptake regulator